MVKWCDQDKEPDSQIEKTAGILPQVKFWHSISILQYICTVKLYTIKGVDFNTCSTLILGMDFNNSFYLISFIFFCTNLFQFWFSTILFLPKTIFKTKTISQNGHHDTNADKCCFKQVCQPGRFWKVTWYTRAGSYPRVFIIVIMQPQNNLLI